MDLSNELININRALACSGINLRIEQRGRWLNLRGPLPCRKGTGTIKSQRISLQIKAEQQGLKEAERVLQLVNYQLQRGQFEWSQWTAKPTLTQPQGMATGVREALANFETTFFADPHRRRSPAGSRTTWTSAYLPYLRRLACLANDKQQGFDASLLSETLASYADGSRSRQQCATALSALAHHLELALPEDWRAEAGGYGLHRARFRQLPSDKQIIEAVLRIPNPGWRLAFGLMATYGLRNHEVFFCDLSALAKGGDHVLRVLPNTKTGEHQVWPFHPNWVEHFELEQLGSNTKALPPVNIDLNHTTLQQVGRRVSEQFRRYELPLTPYNLRHAWAVRTIHIGLPDTVAARMMGHSVAIHTRTYHHWITRRDQQQAVDTALSRKLG
ncbi:MAG: site-specific integrase [Prochlorococcus sp.]|nr:site-specific integrase [Prochlorococcaceae cyanobacterium ETNP14_MAG_4]|tara:strand:+ start:3073 stop:4233 length:1161 start_codon:yes stop_codon:yes gene_type:complete